MNFTHWTQCLWRMVLFHWATASLALWDRSSVGVRTTQCPLRTCHWAPTRSASTLHLQEKMLILKLDYTHCNRYVSTSLSLISPLNYSNDSSFTSRYFCCGDIQNRSDWVDFKWGMDLHSYEILLRL